jgi:hypothetical protein
MESSPTIGLEAPNHQPGATADAEKAAAIEQNRFSIDRFRNHTFRFDLLGNKPVLRYGCFSWIFLLTLPN